MSKKSFDKLLKKSIGAPITTRKEGRKTSGGNSGKRNGQRKTASASKKRNNESRG